MDASVRGEDFSWPPAGTFHGHQRRPHLATSGDFLRAMDMATLAEDARSWTHIEFLARLVAEEAHTARNRRLAARVRFARFRSTGRSTSSTSNSNGPSAGASCEGEPLLDRAQAAPRESPSTLYRGARPNPERHAFRRRSFLLNTVDSESPTATTRAPRASGADVYRHRVRQRYRRQRPTVHSQTAATHASR